MTRFESQVPVETLRQTDDGTVLSNAQIILSDLLGNRRIFMNFQSVSTYSNIDLQVDAKPAVEFDVFPYNQSTRRLLTLRYFMSASALLRAIAPFAPTESTSTVRVLPSPSPHTRRSAAVGLAVPTSRPR